MTQGFFIQSILRHYSFDIFPHKGDALAFRNPIRWLFIRNNATRVVSSRLACTPKAMGSLSLVIFQWKRKQCRKNRVTFRLNGCNISLCRLVEPSFINMNSDFRRQFNWRPFSLGVCACVCVCTRLPYAHSRQTIARRFQLKSRESVFVK